MVLYDQWCHYISALKSQKLTTYLKWSVLVCNSIRSMFPCSCFDSVSIKIKTESGTRLSNYFITVSQYPQMRECGSPACKPAWKTLK